MERRKTSVRTFNASPEAVRRSFNSARTRRQFIQTSARVMAAGALLGRRSFAASRPLKIGYVSPETGGLSAFGETDEFVVSEVRKKIQGGIQSGGSTRAVKVLVRDSQSNPNCAAKIAAALIQSDRIDMMLVAGTPDTVNPVADQCEIHGVPCISCDAPWQAFFFGRGGKPDKGFNWTYHFFWGIELVSQVMCDIFSQVATDKVVGMLMGNDRDGNLLSDRAKGFPPIFEGRGYRVVDPGRFPMSTTDFSAQIAAFKQAKAEILYGNIPSPVFANFWRQAAQQGYKPKVATVGRATVMPAAIEALGALGSNLSIEIWWSNHHPFHSGLTRQSSAQLCEAYEAYSRKQWTQVLGFRHALFEIAIDVFRRAKNPESAASVIEAVRSTRYNSIIGPIQWQGIPPNQWTQNPVKNVCTTPLVCGQWAPGGKWPYELVVTDNRRYPQIPVQRKMVSL